jgi:hypothetical protein
MTVFARGMAHSFALSPNECGLRGLDTTHQGSRLCILAAEWWQLRVIRSETR